MKLFSHETGMDSFDENQEFSYELELALKEVEKMFATSEVVQPTEGFADRWKDRLALQKQKDKKRQIIGLLGFNLVCMLLIAGFLFTNLKVELPTFLNSMQGIFNQFFALFDFIQKSQILISTFSDFVPPFAMISVLMFFSFAFWLFVVMMQQYLNRPRVEERLG